MELEGGTESGGGRGMTRRRRDATRPRYVAMPLEKRELWLRNIHPASRVDGVSMLDGHLAAIVIGPCSIPPDKWLVDLLSVNGYIGSATGDRLAAILAMAARFNVIGEDPSIAPQNYAPIFERMDDGTVLAGPWCMGILAAMQLGLAAWLPLRDLDRIEHGLLLPILLHCTDAFGGPMLGPPREGLETEEFLRTAYHDITLVVPEIRDFWMPHRLKD